MSVITVSQLNTYLSSVLGGDSKLRHFMLQGEVANFKNHTSGHWYFSLKDSSSTIRAVMFRSYAGRMKFLPKDGMKVIVSASVTVYEAGGYYQVNVTDMQPDGVGAAMLSLEQRKEKLRKEGLFDAARKRELPFLPHTVGVVTSSTGDALQDILRTIGNRCPLVRVLIFPVLVQGERAAESIAAGIRFAGAQGCDVIIVGRGGGSSEDLEPFNAEAVAYAIAGCPVPVISAVGHEMDVSIADLAADVRAATPTAAAVAAVPERSALHEQIRQTIQRMEQVYLAGMRTRQQQLTVLSGRLKQCRPDYRIQLHRAECGKLTERLQKAMQLYLTRRKAKIDAGQKECLLLTERMQKSMQLFLAQKSAQLTAQQEKLTQLDPLRILQRGYAAVYNENGAVLTAAAAVRPGERIRVQLAEGSLIARVEEHHAI